MGGFPFNLPDGTGAVGLVLDSSGHPVGLYSRMPFTLSKVNDSARMPAIITRERPDSPDAIRLIGELDAFLRTLYPPESLHGFSIEKLIAEGVAFFVLRSDGTPAACGGILLVDGEYGEIKRMYVRPEYRGMGFAKRMLEHLASHAKAHDIGLLRLETGIHQREAIRLYEQWGFTRIPPFVPHTDDPLTQCYEKRLP